jgi:hypothetical protein
MAYSKRCNGSTAHHIVGRLRITRINGQCTPQEGEWPPIQLLPRETGWADDQYAFLGLINSTTVITKMRRSKRKDQLSI